MKILPNIITKQTANNLEFAQNKLVSRQNTIINLSIIVISLYMSACGQKGQLYLSAETHSTYSQVDESESPVQEDNFLQQQQTQ